jgi:hypothetical protein
MKISLVIHKINATKSNYSNPLGILMWRPEREDLVGATGLGLSSTCPLPSPNAPLPGRLTTCFFRAGFKTVLKDHFLFCGGG